MRAPRISSLIAKPSSSHRFSALATTIAVFCNREVMTEKMSWSSSASDIESGRETSSHRSVLLMAGISLEGVLCITAPPNLRHLLRVYLRVRIPQNVLLHLAHGVARQFIDHEDALRHLEFGEPAVERLQHTGFGDVGTLGADQHRGDAFAEIG